MISGFYDVGLDNVEALVYNLQQTLAVAFAEVPVSNNFMPGLKDLAKETGLSMSTVSRSLSGKGEISAETRERINAAARKLGYVSNLSVHGMMKGKTRTVGVMLNIVDGFYAQIQVGVSRALYNAGYATLTACPAGASANCPPFEPDILQMMLERRVDGLILRPLAAGVGNSYFGELIKRGMPMVHVDSLLEDFSTPFVGTDDYEGGRLAAEHLLKAGHRVLGQIPGNLEISTARDRKAGFESVLLGKPGITLVESSSCGFSSGPSAALELLQATQRPTAIFAANDNVAMAVYKAAHSLDLKVPHDISVIGFGNLPFSDVLEPGLSTLNQFPERIGEAAAKILLRMIDGGKVDSRERVLVKPELMLRGSVRDLNA